MVGDLKLLNSGKVREIYELNDELLLIVTSDRISAFDVIMDQIIPEKGKVLTIFLLIGLRKLVLLFPMPA